MELLYPYLKGSVTERSLERRRDHWRFSASSEATTVTQEGAALHRLGKTYQTTRRPHSEYHNISKFTKPQYVPSDP
jgi:hypothetical protein